MVHATGDVDEDLSPFNHLPDEIVLRVLKKLMDLKTLCICYVVCKRFSSIVAQINSISFTFPPSNSSGTVFRNAVRSMLNFTFLRSLYIHSDSYVDDDCWLFKWKINFSNRIDSFVFLSPDSICESPNGNDSEVQGEIEEEAYDINSLVLQVQKHELAYKCLEDATGKCSILLYLVFHFPLLEKVSVKDSGKRGTVSVSGRSTLAELRNLLPEQRMSFCNFSRRRSLYNIPLLELPVSGYLMKGVSLYIFEGHHLPEDSFINCDFYLDDDDDKFEDKEEAAYTEAITEILKKHRGQMRRLG